MEKIKNLFTNTYHSNSWGDIQSKSGTGSSLEYTESIRKFLVKFILEHLPTDHVKKCLELISKKTNYAFITSSTLKDNVELNDFNGVSSRGINLNLQPYKNMVPKRMSSFWDSIGINDIIDDSVVDNLMYVFKL